MQKHNSASWGTNNELPYSPFVGNLSHTGLAYRTIDHSEL